MAGRRDPVGMVGSAGWTHNDVDEGLGEDVAVSVTKDNSPEVP